MKYLWIINLIFIAQGANAQKMKTKTAFSLNTTATEIVKKIDQIDSFDADGKLVLQTSFNSSNQSKEQYTTSQTNAIEIYTYSAKKEMDSIYNFAWDDAMGGMKLATITKYNYIENNKVNRITYNATGESNVQNYSIKNGTKLFSRYVYKFNKQNQIIEMKLANNAKNKTVIIYNNQKLKSKEQIFEGKKKTEETIYIYNAEKQLKKEQTTMYYSKPYETIITNYEYENGLLKKEIYQLNDEPQKETIYEYSFY